LDQAVPVMNDLLGALSENMPNHSRIRDNDSDVTALSDW
jgi:hypothetical protein